jgi:hypothetical protein
MSMLRRLWCAVGRRGTCLLVFAFLDFTFGYSYLHPLPEARRSSGVHFLDSIAPLWAWGAMWTVVGVVLLVQAFMRNDKIGFACAAGVKVLWALLYMLGAFMGVERAWLSAALWLAIAGWVGVISTWPEVATVKSDDG